MANQQLADYVQGQLKLGVTKEVIRDALTTAGWQAKDVEEVLGTIAASAVSPASAETTPSTLGKGAASSPTFKMSEINFQAKGVASAQKSDEKITPAAKPASEVNSTTNILASRAKPNRLMPVLLAFVAVLGIAAAVFFYLQTHNLQAAVRQLNADKAGLSEKVAAAAKENSDLKTKLASGVAEVADLNDTLLLFIAPSGATTQEVSLTASGVLSGGDAKNPYVVTTARGVKLTIKNGKLANIDSVLKSLVGTTVQITVTHVPGSSQVTLVTVNGKGFAATSAPPAKP